MENKPAGGPVFPQVAQAGSEHTVNGFGRSVALRSCKALAQASCSLQTNSPVECRRRCLEMVSWRDALGAEPQHSKACCKSFPNHHPGRLQSPTHAGVQPDMQLFSDTQLSKLLNKKDQCHAEGGLPVTIGKSVSPKPLNRQCRKDHAWPDTPQHVPGSPATGTGSSRRKSRGDNCVYDSR